MPREYFEVRNFRGFVTEVSPEDMAPEYAQVSENVKTDEKIGSITRRRGSEVEHAFSSGYPSIKGPIKTLFPIDKTRMLAGVVASVGGKAFLIDSVGPPVWSYIDQHPDDFNGLSQYPVFDMKYRMVKYLGVIYIATGVYPLAYWNPSIRYLRLVGRGLEDSWKYAAYNVPWAKYIAVHKDVLFLANGSACPDSVYYSAFSDFDENIVAPYEPQSWQGSNYNRLGNGEDITGIISYGNIVVITQKNHIWVVGGDYPEYIWQEITLDTGDRVGGLPDTMQIKDGILYGADEKCIWELRGTVFKDITARTIKSTYQDRGTFPIMETDSLWFREQVDYGSGATARLACTNHSIDMEAQPGVIQIPNFQNMTITVIPEEGGWDNPASGVDGNCGTATNAREDEGNEYEDKIIQFEFKDPYDEPYQVLLKDLMIHYNSAATINIKYKDEVHGYWKDANKHIPATLDPLIAEMRYISLFNDEIKGVWGLRFIIKGKRHALIHNMWFPGGGTYTLPSAKRCKGVKAWGLLEADIKLNNNTGAVGACEPKDPSDGVVIYLWDEVTGWMQKNRGELIQLAYGDVDIKWKVLLQDSVGGVGDPYPNYPKFYAIKLPWLKEGSEWWYQPTAQTWDDKIYYSFPHEDNPRFLVLDQNNDFHIYPCRNSISSMCVFDDKLYGGKTQSNASGYGEILRLDTGLVDSDSDGEEAITLKWRTKEFRLKDPRRKCELRRLEITAENKEASGTNDLMITYVIDGIPKSKTITTTAGKEKTYNVWFPSGTKAHRVYFECEGTFDMQIKQLIVEVNALPLITGV